jgi:hypothetical protein
MTIRPDLWLAATVLVIAMISSNAGAQEPQRPGEATQAVPENEKATGILTDQLNKSQLKAWKSILAAVFARDPEGRLIHPKLNALYQQAETCTQGIRIELSTRISPLGPVAWCKTRKQADDTQQAPVVIRLNLGLIDGAVTSPIAQRVNGFIPFAGLGKKERYAEALGHELAHAVRFLMDAEYMGYYRQLERLKGTRGSSPNGETIERLISLIEEPAEAAELEIWHELTAGRQSKM